MEGGRPVVLLGVDLASLLPLLVLGAQTHDGSRTTLGQSCYRLYTDATTPM